MNNIKENKEQSKTDSVLPKNQSIAPNANVQFADSTMIAMSQYDLKVFFGFSFPNQHPPDVYSAHREQCCKIPQNRPFALSLSEAFHLPPTETGERHPSSFYCRVSLRKARPS